MARFASLLLAVVLSFTAPLVRAQSPDGSTRVAANTPAPLPRPVRAKGPAPRVLDGYVLGIDGLALPGVTARLVGSGAIVVSNADGMFRLPLPSGRRPLRLVCSYAGLADCEVVIAPDQCVLSLEMLEAATGLLVRGRRH